MRIAFPFLMFTFRNRLLRCGGLIVLFAAPPGRGQDQSILADIHKRLQSPGIEARHDHDRMLFVGEIVGFGPVYQGVCKTGVSETVDFRVTSVLLGKPPQPVVHAQYINCSRMPLPSPPFTLHDTVIVYCFHNMGAFKCLEPVRSTEHRIESAKSWVAHMPAEKGEEH